MGCPVDHSTWAMLILKQTPVVSNQAKNQKQICPHINVLFLLNYELKGLVNLKHTIIVLNNKSAKYNYYAKQMH